jgi:hypothetical protein
MPLRLTDVAAQLLKDIDAAKKLPQYDGIDFAPFRAKVVTYLATAKLFDASLLAAERSGDVASIDARERQAEIARDTFWMPDGLSYNKYWHTIDRFVAPFPELNYAAYETTGRDAAVAAALGRLETSVDKATNALHV